MELRRWNISGFIKNRKLFRDSRTDVYDTGERIETDRCIGKGAGCIACGSLQAENPADRGRGGSASLCGAIDSDRSKDAGRITQAAI